MFQQALGEVYKERFFFFFFLSGTLQWEQLQ